MEDNATAPQATIPVHVPQPPDNAPPTLAQPASGPVAEMSGALNASDDSTKPTQEPAQTETETSPVNGTSASEPQATSTEAEKPADETTTMSAPEDSATIPTGGEDATAEAPNDQSAPAEPNGAAVGTPKGGAPKRKSTGGVPEHKSKKLNRKQSKQKITHLDAQPGDCFFARLKSYPPWPSIVCDEEMLPGSLITTRPVTTKKADGTYRPDYDDGGKKVGERTFPVMFLYTNEFAWIPNTDLGDLDPEDCKNVSEKGKAKSLIAAYQVAAEQYDLQHFKDILVEHENALQAEAEARQAKASEKAEKVAKSDKKRRKSEAAAAAKGADEDEDVDMEDAEDTTTTKKSSKKRKKEVDSEDEGTEKPAKTPKTKLKLTTGKTPTTDKKSKDTPKAKPKSEKKSRKSAVADDEDEDEVMEDTTPKEPEPPVDPVERRKEREKEVLFLRHKLQKGFLSREQAPQDDEMPQMSSYIKKLEGYTDLDAGIIRSTKINKVLKALIKLNTIPRDEEFHFKSRSIELLNKMGKLLGASDTDLDPADGGAEKDTEAEPATNGITKEEDAKPSTPAVEAAPFPAVDDAPSAEPAKTTDAPSTEPEPTVAANDDTTGAEPIAQANKTQPTIPEPAKVEPEEATSAGTTATLPPSAPAAVTSTSTEAHAE